MNRSIQFIGVAIVLALILAPYREDAQGFFGIFPKTEAQAPDLFIGQNSQNIIALASNLAPDRTPAELLIDIDVKDNSALSANMGPIGTAYDFTQDILVPDADEVTLYVVKSGDTLSGIAKMFGVSTNTIVWANNLDRSKALKTGQEVLILPVSGVKHIVKKGDTLASIAKKYKGDVDEIKLYNDISGNTVSVGTEIIIPNGEVSTPTVVKKSSSSSSSASTPKSTSTSKANSSGYIKPVSGIVTQWAHGTYRALDIGNRTGTPIYAIKEGRVIAAKGSGYNGGYGLMVIIDHGNGVQSLYAHMSKIRVSVGDYVIQGQQIGDVGSTGRSTGPHLHFETRGNTGLAASIYKK